MKKVIFLFIIMLLFPAVVNADVLNRHVTIELKSNNHNVETVVKFKIKKDNSYINDTLYETNDIGIFESDLMLEDGNYELEIVEIPTNILSYTTKFTVDSDIVKHIVNFSEQKGTISIHRKGVFLINDSEVYIDGINTAEYEIYAKEDINSYTGIKYKKDELIDTITTYDGYSSIVLPIGSYYVIEKSVKNYLSYESRKDVTIDLNNIYNEIYINTLHQPLEINTNIDYKLCSKENIIIDDKIVVYKNTCFDNKSKYYYLPYGQYLFISDINNQTIDFNEENTLFEFIHKDDQNENINDDEKLNTDNEVDNGINNDIVNIDKNDDGLNDQNNNIENSYSSDIKSTIPTNNQSIENDDIVVNDKNSMPITSSRSNKYSLLISGLIFIVISIIKK